MSDEKNLWLVFIVSQPGKSQTPRIRLWRALKALGAAVLRDGVYLLPRHDSLYASLDEQAVAVRELGGTAYLLELQTQTEEEQTEFTAMFDRGEDYAAFLTNVRQRQRDVATSNETQARRAWQQLQRDLDAIRRIDYFPGPGLTQAEQAVADIERSIQQRFSPDEPHPAAVAIETCDIADFQDRLWATRRHLWVDRVACAWLIRRFIDPRARFMWLRAPVDCPADAIGFDFDRARFSHTGDQITFEVLLASFDLATDPALVRLGMNGALPRHRRCPRSGGGWVRVDSHGHTQWQS